MPHSTAPHSTGPNSTSPNSTGPNSTAPNSTSNAWTPVLVTTLVAAAIILSISMGLRQSLGLFLGPMANAGISVAGFGLAMAIQNLAWGIGQPFMGALCDRFGGRLVVLISAALYCAGLALMATGGTTALYLGGGVLIGLAVAGTSYGVLVGIISRLADPAVRAIAVSILAAAGSLGTFVLAPSAQVMINAVGWQWALAGFVAIAAVMGVLALLLRQPAVATASGSRPDARSALREALASRTYVISTLAFFACGFQLIFIATHLPNYLAICGLPPSVGANAIALIGICNVVGTLAAGWLSQRWGNRQVLALIYLLRTVAIAAFFALPVSPASALTFAAAMGFLWLSVVPPVSGMINARFGPANFGTLFGVMFLSHQIGAFLGAWLGGLIFQLNGSYTIAWSALIVVGLIAAGLQILAGDDGNAGAVSAA